MAFDAYTGYLQVSFNYNASKNGPSSSLNLPSPNVANTINLKVSYAIGSGAGQVNEAITEILTIAASGSATIDLTVLADVLNTSGVALTKLKAFLFALLSAAQDTINGTACSGIVIGNAATNGNKLNMGAVTDTKILTNGDIDSYATASAAGITVSSTAKSVLVTNSDSGVAAGVLACFQGA